MCDIENRDIDNNRAGIAGVEYFGECIPEFLLKSFNCPRGQLILRPPVHRTTDPRTGSPRGHARGRTPGPPTPYHILQ